MKKTHILISLAVMVGIVSTGCEELFGDLLKFDTNYYGYDITIEPSDTLGLLTFTEEVITGDLDPVLQENGVSRDNLKSAILKEGKAKIQTMGFTFDPVSDIELHISSEGLGSKKIAWLDPIPEGATEITLELTGDDLKDYLLADEFTIMAVGTLTSQVESEVVIRAEVKFELKGGL